MKLECQQRELSRALKLCKGAINHRTSLPICKHVLLDSSNGVLRCSGTDIDSGVTIEIPATVHEPGSIACPANLLEKIVAKCPPEALEIYSYDCSLDLNSGDSTFTLPTLPATEFPNFPEEALEWIELPARKLKEALQRVVFATACLNESRAILTGVNFGSSENNIIKLAATDGRRMGYQELEHSESGLLIKGTVMGRAMKLLVRMLPSSDELVRLTIDKKTFFCQVGPDIIFSRLLDGVGPDWRRVIEGCGCPQRVATVNRKTLLGALQRVILGAQEKQSPNLVEMKFESEFLYLSARSPKTIKVNAKVPIVMKGDSMKIAFNALYWIQALTVLKCEEIELDLQDNTRNAALRESGSSVFKYIVMPVRIYQVEEES